VVLCNLTVSFDGKQAWRTWPGVEQLADGVRAGNYEPVGWSEFAGLADWVDSDAAKPMQPTDDPIGLTVYFEHEPPPGHDQFALMVLPDHAAWNAARATAYSAYGYAVIMLALNDESRLAEVAEQMRGSSPPIARDVLASGELLLGVEVDYERDSTELMVASTDPFDPPRELLPQAVSR
jgi:hypothetical protein